MLAMQSLRQHRHGERSSLAAHMQPRFDVLLVGVDVLLELARQELAHLGVQAIHVGDQRQQRHQDQQQDE